MPKMIKALFLKDNKISPWRSAITERVIPHPGQYISKYLYVKHCGKVIFFATNTAVKYRAITATTGRRITNIFFEILYFFISFPCKKGGLLSALSPVIRM